MLAKEYIAFIAKGVPWPPSTIQVMIMALSGPGRAQALSAFGLDVVPDVVLGAGPREPFLPVNSSVFVGDLERYALHDGASRAQERSGVRVTMPLHESRARGRYTDRIRHVVRAPP